jgi:dihydropyrimidinase
MSANLNALCIFDDIPQKGSIAVGFDADLVLWDADRKEVIRQELMHHGADYTPYEGVAVTGWPVMTILRGKVVAQEGKILGEPGDGSFHKRKLSPYAAPRRPPAL